MFTKRLGVSIPEHAFAAQIADLVTRHNVLPFSRFVTERFDPRSVAVTLDDGYRSILTVALPILEAAKCPVKIFLNSDQVDGNLGWLNKLSVIQERSSTAELAELARHALPNRIVQAPSDPWEYWRFFEADATVQAIDDAYALLAGDFDHSGLFLSRADLEALRDHPLIEWGSHTANHLPLDRLSADGVTAQITAGHASLKRTLGDRLDGFALPFGASHQLTPEIAAAVRPIDHYLVSATGSRINYSLVDGMHEIQRLSAEHDTDALIARLAS